MREPDAETVPLEKLTRFYLANHFLLREAEHTDIVDVAATVCGLHAQVPSTPYISLWNRVHDFTSETLDRALYTEKSLVKAWFMRGTLHIIPARYLPTYHKALKRMWFEQHGRHAHDPDWPTQEELEKLLYPTILKALEDKPLSRKELSNRFRSMVSDASGPYERLFSAWGGILKETNYLGLTLHAEPCNKESCFARVDKWLPHVNLDEVNEDEAKAKLLLKYLQCFGPASAQDFACWSGLLASEANQLIEDGERKLSAVQVDGSRKTLWMLKSDTKAFGKVDVEEEVQPRLLPKYDSYLLGHKDRTRIIDDQYLKQVYRPVIGDIAATILVNGRIAGTWMHKRTTSKLTVALHSFKKLDRETIIQLRDAVNKLGAFMKVRQAEILSTP